LLAQFLCGAQELGESQIPKAGAGFRGVIIFPPPIRQYTEINTFFPVREAWHEA
jgi:hypothetical protein